MSLANCIRTTLILKDKDIFLAKKIREMKVIKISSISISFNIKKFLTCYFLSND